MPSDNDKRIAKNTLVLYFRMIFMMGVNLFTSRVALNALGVDDYGTHNVVGGVVTMFGFISGSLAGASSRFITFNLGRGDMATLKRTFGNIMTIHAIMAVAVLIVGEAVGVWFLLNHIQLPPGRETAALWVFQFSLLAFAATVVSSPYNAAIIAHEHMTAFAYISIADAMLKLLTAFMLIYVSCDKLILYGALTLAIHTIDLIVYYAYCSRHFAEVHSRWACDKKLFGELFAYAGWTLNGSLAVIGFTQGLNVVLNLFFGPAVNAARGIAVQVQNVCSQFYGNFQIALNPQLTKSYARGELDTMHRLLVKSSKFSFYILFVIALPLMLEADAVLQLWLGLVPEHTVSFLRLVLCISLLGTLANPIIVSVHATGRLKKFQLIEATMLLTIVPIAYVLLKLFSLPPETVFIVHLAVEAITQYARLRIVLPMIKMRLRLYATQVVARIVPIAALAPIAPTLLYINTGQTVVSFLAVCATSLLSCALTMYFIGCTKNERLFLKEKALLAARKPIEMLHRKRNT